MADCERLETCPFFTDQMPDMPAVAELIKQTYCHGDKTQCARYQVAVLGLKVPPALYPLDIARAKEIIQGN